MEYKTIKEISTEIIQGGDISKYHKNRGEVPAILCGDLSKFGTLKEAVQKINPEEITKKVYCKKNDVLIITKGYSNSTFRALAYLGEEDCLIGNHVLAIRSEMDPRYLSYALSSAKVSQQRNRVTRKGTMCHIYKSDIENIRIPVPSLEKQKEIAGVLEAMTDSSALAEKIAQEREKQVNFILDNFEDFFNLV